ncbi:MAG TPA: TonB-dependent receptor [Puia sp.]|nr:TonB-dependent receptor [Puia sp.]
MKKLFFLLCLLLGYYTGVQAQSVKGRVLDDSTGEGLPQVSVTVSGVSVGTTTGADGFFSLFVPPDGKTHTLQFSYAGYTTMTLPLRAQERLVVRMKSEPKELEDVVIIGYQTVRRRDLMASVSSISSRDLKDVPVNSAPEALAGRLAGVQVTGADGAPDAQILITVRGGGSITQSNAPLYIVDGVQLDNALQTLSPQDIASIDVLKDAAATSIYGARGSNGVVIITTKGGRNTSGRTTVAYNGFAGIGTLEKSLPVLGPYDYMYYQYERAQLTGDTTGIAPYGNSWDSVQKYRSVPYYDWQKRLIGRNAFQQTHNISINGGTDVTQYNLSLTDNDQDGQLLLSAFHRKLLSFRFDHKASERLKIGANIRFNNTIVDGMGIANPGSSALNFLRQIIRYRPFIPAGQDANTFDFNYLNSTDANSLSLVNPVLLDQSTYRKSSQNILDLNGYAQFSFSKFLSLRSTAGFDYNNLQQNAFDDTLTYNSQISGAGLPLADIKGTVITTIDNSNVFTYSNAAGHGRFHEHNDLTAIVGEETYQTTENDNYVQTDYFPLGTTAQSALANMNLGSPPNNTLVEPKPTSGVIPTRLLSFFSRVTYAFDKKYMLAVSGRADASSLFAANNRWGYFPSASAAWRISQEKFLENVGFINDLKLRGSFGTAGNNRIAPFQYLTQFNTNSQYALDGRLVTAYASAGLANPDLKWETTTSRDIGLDATVWGNRLSFAFDVYNNTTSGLLVNVPVPTTTGYVAQIQNVGSTRNKGFEAQVGATVMQKKSFRWTGSFNISFNQNKITSLGPNQTSYLANSGWAGSSNPADFIVKVGQPVGAMYGYVSDGFYTTNDFNYEPATRTYTLKPGEPNDANITSSTPMPGSIKYKGLNGDTIITAADRTIIGNSQPKFFGGLQQQFYYKNFDMSIFINFQYGNKIYNDNKLEFSSGYTPGANLLGIEKNRWHTVDANGNVYESLVGGKVVGASPDSLNALNKSAKLWMPLVGSSSTTFSPNSWAAEDGSFIRINNITVGYSLPANWVHKLRMTRFRVYVTVNNVAVITHYTGYDPEVNTRTGTPVTPGVDYSAYPRARTFIGGVNIAF